MKKTKLGHIFQKYSNLLGENEPLLFPDKTNEKEDYSHVPYEHIISQGAVKFLEKWPSHLYTTFLLGCLIISVIFSFILITIFFTFSTERSKNRETRDVKIGESHNVYFIKHENRTWSRKELCFIETAAHKHPELNVYLINLISEDFQKNNNSIPGQFIDMKNFSSFSKFLDVYNRDKSFVTSKNVSLEMLLRKKIAYHNSNVRNVDISTEQFFWGSMLNNVYKNLKYEILEIAAKSNILWNYPGIALNPVMFDSINKIEKQFCKSEETCKPDNNFIIQLQGDLQASSVPCHSFAEFLMKGIIKNQLFDQYLGLKKILNDFCPRSNNCGITIMEETSTHLPTEIFCPTIYTGETTKD